MFNEIMWATDGSEHADRALNYASGLAQSQRASLHVVHIVEKFAGSRARGQDQRADEPELDDRIRDQADRLRRETGLEVHVHMPRTSGSVAKKIAEIAERKGVDLIVAGTRGRSAAAGAVLGSVTQQLLHVGHCPVLAVPPLAQTSTSAAEVDELAAAG